MRNVSDKFAEKIKTLNLYVITIFVNPLIYDKRWKSIVQQDRPYITIRRVRIACWITKATNTHSECEPSIAFPLQKWLQERSSMLCLHVHCLACNITECHLKCYILMSECQFWFCSQWSCTKYCSLSPWFGSSPSYCHIIYCILQCLFPLVFLKSMQIFRH